MLYMHRPSLYAALVAFLLFTGSPQAKSKKPKTPAFSYYMLVRSYGPDFCSEPGGDRDPRECGTG